MPAKVLDLDEVRIDGEIQARAAIDEAVVAEYAERMAAGDKFPALDVFHDGSVYWLADGFHRYHAARKAGVARLACLVKPGTRDDAAWAACGANQTHGLRRTNEDKREAVRKALRLRPNLADTAIAEHCGVHRDTVAAHRATCGNSASGTKRTGRDGRTIETAKIGKTQPRGRMREPGEDDGEPPPDPDDIPMEPAGPVDKTGRPVEGKVAEAFARRQEIQDLMTAVSKVKTTVLKAVEAKDPLYADLNPSRFEAEANSLHHQLRSAMPYARCGYCRAAGCRACLGRGWLGEFAYQRMPSEMKR
jgi:hypothetical protein